LELKKCGYHVIGIDQNCTAAGFFTCDIKIQESIYNYEDIYKKIQEFLLDGEIKGVLTRSYGAAVKSVAFINEKISIPYINFRTIDNLIDKRKMKHVLTQNKIRTPAMILIKGPHQIKFFPCVVKPIRGHAKNGVRYIETFVDAKDYFDEYAGDDKEFLAEKYIVGDEIIAAVERVLARDPRTLPKLERERRNGGGSGIDGCWCCYAARAGVTTINACYASIRRNICK